MEGKREEVGKEVREGEAFVTEGSRRLTGVTNASGDGKWKTPGAETPAPGDAGGMEIAGPGAVEEEVGGIEERPGERGASGLSEGAPSEVEEGNELIRRPRLLSMKRGSQMKRPAGRLLSKAARRQSTRRQSTKLTAEQRLLILDTWGRSGLPAAEFASIVGVSKHTLYVWKKRFEEMGPAGLMDQPRGGPEGSRLPETTKRAILMIKGANPEYGCRRISEMLLRGPALPASAGAVARVLKEAGYETEEVPTVRNPERPRRFERARANQLWQTDIFTFLLKRQNRRVYLLGFMDDYSRFMVGYGVHASCSGALVLEVLRAAIASYGPPEEILTDNGPQFVTWRGKSKFTKELEKQGIRQVVARAKRPQTLGKIERFWGTLWRECAETSVFLDLEDARRRIGLFIDHYNFQRTHQGIEGLVPADRFFGAASEVLKTLKQRVAKNALELARKGVPKEPFYLTGQVGGKSFSVHSEGERVILKKEGEERAEVDLSAPVKPEKAVLPEPLCPGARIASIFDGGDDEEPEPGVSVIDGLLKESGEAEGSPGATEEGTDEAEDKEKEGAER